MLKLKPDCECCNKDLPPESTEAVICTFECTFCTDCSEERFANKCPNCGGNLETRPIRPPELLAEYPASTQRITKAKECRKQLFD